MPDVAIDRLDLAFLVDYALVHLWNQTWDAPIGADTRNTCCPNCCGPCSVLRKFHEQGLLDKYVEPYMQDPYGPSDFWDDNLKQVKREWLYACWSPSNCCEL